MPGQRRYIKVKLDNPGGGGGKGGFAAKGEHEDKRRADTAAKFQPAPAETSMNMRAPGSFDNFGDRMLRQRPELSQPGSSGNHMSMQQLEPSPARTFRPQLSLASMLDQPPVPSQQAMETLGAQSNMPRPQGPANSTVAAFPGTFPGRPLPPVVPQNFLPSAQQQ